MSSLKILTLSWRRPLSYRNQSVDLLWKSTDLFLYENGLRYERVKRPDKMSMVDYINEFERLNNKIRKSDMKLSTEVLA